MKSGCPTRHDSKLKHLSSPLYFSALTLTVHSPRCPPKSTPSPGPSTASQRVPDVAGERYVWPCSSRKALLQLLHPPRHRRGQC